MLPDPAQTVNSNCWSQNARALDRVGKVAYTSLVRAFRMVMAMVDRRLVDLGIIAQWEGGLAPPSTPSNHTAGR